MNHLKKTIPDLDRLLADPRTVLTEKQICIEPSRIGLWYWMAALFAFVVAVVLVALISQSIWVTALVFVGGPLAVFWVMRNTSSPHILIHAKGAEFWFGRSVVFCPWELFNSTGRQLLSESSSMAGIIIPIQASAVPKVFHSRGGRVQAIGIRVHCPHVSIISWDDMCLIGEFQAPLLEVAGLLLELGRKLTAEESTTTESTKSTSNVDVHVLPILDGITSSPADSAADSAAIQETCHRDHANGLTANPPGPTVDGSGFIGKAKDTDEAERKRNTSIVIPITRLQFPPYCSCCCAPASTGRSYRIPGATEAGLVAN